MHSFIAKINHHLIGITYDVVKLVFFCSFSEQIKVGIIILDALHIGTEVRVRLLFSMRNGKFQCVWVDRKNFVESTRVRTLGNRLFLN
jgi:hypothetical protein